MAAKSTQNYRFLATFLTAFYRFSKMDFLKVHDGRMGCKAWMNLRLNTSSEKRSLQSTRQCTYIAHKIRASVPKERIPGQRHQYESEQAKKKHEPHAARPLSWIRRRTSFSSVKTFASAYTERQDVKKAWGRCRKSSSMLEGKKLEQPSRRTYRCVLVDRRCQKTSDIRLLI